MGNAAVDRDNWPDVMVIGFSGSLRHAILTAVLLGLVSFTASPACWEIAMPGKTITATDLWQIRNRVSGENILLGETEGERHVVSLEQIKSMTIVENVESSWLSGNRSAVEIEIQLIDDQTLTLASEMNLYYLADDKRHVAPLGDVISVHRCADESAGVPPPPEIINPLQASPILVMKNGDILYGKVTGGQLDWQTAYASVAFTPAGLKMIKVACAAPAVGILETKAGDRLNGNFVNMSLSFHLTTGQIINIPTDQIRMVDFVGTQVADRIAIEECNSSR